MNKHFNFEEEHQDETLIVIKPRRNRFISSFTLRLTPMIDMFTILLVFLLKSFSLEGEIISVAPDLRLPESTAKTKPKASPILLITPEWLVLDGEPVEKVSTVIAQPQNSIGNLRANLQRIRIFSENLGELDANMMFKGNITIQGDRSIPFLVLKKIMFTCGQEGFNTMLLAVNQKEEG
jgi:biopolymer transport protein ExbD